MDDNLSEGPGKFDQGNLKFNHALSRVTINLKKGTGYGEGTFSFATGTNVKILKAPISGKLDIEAGEWKEVKTGTITMMGTTELASGASYSLMAQILPGYEIKEGVNDKIREAISESKG